MTTVDVGDAFELVFTTVTGATVLRSWYDPDDTPIVELEPIVEFPAGTGRYPYTFQATRAGTWTARVTVSGTATAVEEHHVYARAVPAVKPLAVVGHVTEQFGALSAAQEGLTKALLRAASKLVRAQFPNVDAQLASGALDPDVVALAATNMVLRVLRNPRGLRGQTIGPFSYTYDTSLAAGELVIGPNEQAVLSPVTAAASAIGSVRIRAGMAPPIRGRGYRGGW